jgi:unsaturated chondroitin disaccharide hydrolase
MRALNDELDGLIGEALDLIARKTLDDDGRIGTDFPYVTDEDGAWKTLPAALSAGYSANGWSHGNWFCGFWVGLLLVGYLRTGEDRFLDRALARMRLVAPRAADPNTHDIGFMFLSSAIPAWRITGERWLRNAAFEAAAGLRRRLVPTRRHAYLAAWGPLSDPRGRASSAIDTMANLPLLYWAATEAEDASFLVAAEEHAKATRDTFIRDDFSTYHAVEYDLPAGTRRRGFTFQGYADESLWSRGQGWAIYGYAATAAATGNPEYLRLAERLAEVYLARAAGDSAPWWDFDDPAIPDAPRDSSAAAIVASALLDVAALHPDAGAGARWQGEAERIVSGLCRNHLARDDGQRGILKDGCYSQPHRDGTASAVLFGDYFFAEALCKLAVPGRLVDRLERLSAG